MASSNSKKRHVSVPAKSAPLKTNTKWVMYFGAFLQAFSGGISATQVTSPKSFQGNVVAQGWPDAPASAFERSRSLPWPLLRAGVRGAPKIYIGGCLGTDFGWSAAARLRQTRMSQTTEVSRGQHVDHRLLNSPVIL